jgi:MFS family permease
MMAEMAAHKGAGVDRLLRIAFWSFAALMLLAPLVAMRFTGEVNWDETDFIFAGVLIGAVGIAFEATMRMTRSWAYRFAAGFAALAAFMIVWANAAVGMIGDEDNPYNLYFIGVIGLALVGAVAARLRAAGMSLVMLAAGIAHLAVAAGGLSADQRGAILSAAFAGLWLLSAALFRVAARDQERR